MWISPPATYHLLRPIILTLYLFCWFFLSKYFGLVSPPITFIPHCSTGDTNWWFSPVRAPGTSCAGSEGSEEERAGRFQSHHRNLLLPTRSPGRYVLNIHFYIESCQKMIQFNIPFKTKSKIFIQKNYSFKKIPNYPFKENIHSSEKRDYHPGLRTTIAQKQHFSPKTQFLG